MFRNLKRRFQNRIARRRAAGLEEAVVHSAMRFEQWLEGVGAAGDLVKVDAALGEALAKEELPESLANDAASWLGEFVRAQYQESLWGDDDLYGLHLTNLGGIGFGKFMPLAMVEKKWELRGRFSVAEFLEKLPARIDAEKEAAAAHSDTPPPRWRIEREQEPLVVVHHHLQEWVAFWRRRFRADLPPTLLGVREMDKYIRTHYILNFIREDEVVNAGYFLGEVARGLFDGEWEISNAETPAESKLKYPELDFYPVGKVYKLVTERPEDQQLDEYIRLIPAARAEMRKAKG